MDMELYMVKCTLYMVKTLFVTLDRQFNCVLLEQSNERCSFLLQIVGGRIYFVLHLYLRIHKKNYNVFNDFQ